MPGGRPKTVTAAQARAQGYYRPSRHGPLPSRPRVSAQLLEIAPGAEPEPPVWMTPAEGQIWRETMVELAGGPPIEEDTLSLYVSLKARLQDSRYSPTDGDRSQFRKAAERLRLEDDA